jgi:hypothetical protein
VLPIVAPVGFPPEVLQAAIDVLLESLVLGYMFVQWGWTGLTPLLRTVGWGAGTGILWILESAHDFTSAHKALSYMAALLGALALLGWARWQDADSI